MKTIIQFLALTLTITLLAPCICMAQWIIVPPPPHDILPVPVRPPMNMEIRAIKVTGNIVERAGELLFEEVLYNPNPYQLEGTFYFPLLKGMSIKDFAMWVNGSKMAGEILDSKKARKIYEDIVRQMRDPALLEYMDNDMFRCRVFPILPRGEVRIEIRLTQILDYDAGKVQLQLPLKQACSGGQSIRDLVIDLEIKSPVPLGNFYSPSFDLDVVPRRGNSYRVSYEGSRVSADRDFSLFYNYIEEDVGVSVLGYRPRRTDGYFMVLLAPSWDISPRSVSAKEIVYIIDTSGSMRKDRKINQVKDALSFGLQGLNNNDLFNIVAFSSEARSLHDSLVKVNRETIEEAEDFVSMLSSRGGTNINDALRLGMSMFSNSNRPKILVFLTDGQPTSGVCEPNTILSNITAAKRKDIRIFSFGVGYDVNTYLLDKLANIQRGSSSYVEPEENLEITLSSFFEKIESPVLTDISIDFGNLKVSDMYPVNVPDLFKGSQLTLVGRYRNPGEHTITVQGTLQGDRKNFRFPIYLPERDSGNDFLPHIWAARKIGYLLDAIRMHGESEELVEEVVHLSKEYGIPTPYTSYLITEDEHQYARRERPGILPVPLGRSHVTGAADAEPSFEAKKAQVQESKAVNEMRSVDSLSSLNLLGLTGEKGEGTSEKPLVQRAGDKTFLYHDGWWIDTGYDEKKNTIKIKFLSSAYFDLLKLHPVLAKYAGLGDRVKISLNGLNLEINEGGQDTLSSKDMQTISRALSD